MRPCKHQPPHPTCHVCWCCRDLTDPVNKLRREKWSEPEPNSPAGLNPNRYIRRPCKHLGESTGEEVQCAQCGQYEKKVGVYACTLWKECTVDKVGRRVNEENIAKYLPNCKTCKQYDPVKNTNLTTNEFIPGESDPIPTQPNQSPSWAHFPAIAKEHNNALKELLHREFKGPNQAEGQGLILCGGTKYWPMLMLSLKMFRDVSSLPVQIWHKGDDEPVPVQDLEGIPNVSVHSVWDTTPRPRIVKFFEVKTHALIHCGWEQVFYLDADAYLIRDPAPLFKLVKEAGFVYWPSYPSSGQKELWKWVDVQNNGMPNIQGGQYLIDRVKCWRELVLTYWMDQHSDYFYQHYQSNDEDSWRVAFSATRNACYCIDEMNWQEVAWLCAYQKQTYVIHRCGGKFWLHSKPRLSVILPKEQEVAKHLLTLNFDRYKNVVEAANG